MNSRLVSLPLILIVYFLLCGCHQNGSVNPTRYHYTSPEEAALSAVSQASLKFTVPFSEDSYAWERAQFFFVDAIKAGKPAISYGSNNAELFISGGSKRFLYSIRKMPVSGGYSYQVACIERGSNSVSQQSDLNARNLGRFIQKGTLEKKALSF